MSVSYTHLDVYKRQVSHRPSEHRETRATVQRVRTVYGRIWKQVKSPRRRHPDYQKARTG